MENLKNIREFLEKIISSQDNIAERIVNCIISQGILNKASDIHFIPKKEKVSIKYRIDGALHFVAEIPINFYEGIIVKTKVMSNLLVYRQDIPQEGNIVFKEKDIELRVTIFPTVWGERIVIRILDYSFFQFDLDKLGFPEKIRSEYENIIKKSNGVILLTGPSNSGKTTTIYSTIQRKLKDEPYLNVVTVEDPIEFKFDNISQTQINNEITYSNALKSILRQDIDVIMVGEIRDYQTARMVMEGGLTGHLVLSTLHAGTSARVIIRLIKMGIEPFLLSSSLICILTQRLVRKICENCKKEFIINKKIIDKLGLPEGITLYKGSGCQQCRNTGYKGRIVIAELIILDNAIREKILEGVSINDIQCFFKERGIKTIYEDGIEKVKQGITTIEEIKRVLQNE